jgi:bifunctional DNA-binding transcriptional regulator/antitoxin component of YhaV-PrlF toxin-antitoxin module
MRLQKQVNRKVQESQYEKYVVVIPKEHIEELGWEAGEELDGQVQGRRFVIFPKSETKERKGTGN